MGLKSRNKGADFERRVAKELEDLLGIKFRRNLEQYQTKNLGDLVPDDPAFLFVLELKKYAKGNGCKPAWWEQADKAALASGKKPAVIWSYNNAPIRVTVHMSDLLACLGCTENHEAHLFDMSLEAFAYVAREGMA